MGSVHVETFSNLVFTMVSVINFNELSFFARYDTNGIAI